MEGAPTGAAGVVLSGRVIIEMSDVWGNNSVLSSVSPGGTFAEAYACIPGSRSWSMSSPPEDSTVLLLNARQVLTPCSHACACHAGLIRNLLTLCAGKEFAALPPDDAHQPRAHPHAAFILLFGMYQAKRQLCLRYSYNRQQLADYLNVERSALSNELSLMRQDGILRYDKITSSSAKRRT